ncbi:hypothetical protein NC796_11450 [Aliifodinibius sp. S!AR15-10]|uniref:hypothetical protein n=1 Tax=Aliifodinibius sp. S!AR15-10 TaxID=2950437 RepID=UPI002860E2D5|nr:hypothetical protein [Aliifodinibius sp. S!AR15-10]MDR8391762.1 hypothetical protein [Aliifodinibius sp. S!AR15-10]
MQWSSAWLDAKKRDLKKAYDRISDYSQSERGKRVGRWSGYLIQAGIIAYLLYELTQIGWNNFFDALPTTPYFYLLFLVLYGALPVAEFFCYKQSWNIGFRESLPVFIKKRIYNKTVAGYSGEFVVFGWGRKRGFANDKELFKVIRDNNIMSSLASSAVVYALLLGFVLSGEVALLDYLGSRYDILTITGTVVIALLLVVTAYKFRSYFFSMSSRVAWRVFGIHTVRMIFLNVVQVLQWYVVLPEITLDIWFTFLSVQLLISRIPVIPSRDLISIGASLEVSNYVDISPAGIAGILVAHSVLNKLLNLALFSLITFLERKHESKVEQSNPG